MDKHLEEILQEAVEAIAAALLTMLVGGGLLRAGMGRRQ